MFATAAWAFGSLWSRRLDLPKGMMAPGAEMFAAGLVLVGFSLLHGEHLPAVVPARAIAAIAYLVVFGSLVAYTAYLYLLAHVPLPVASSYAYVNPLVALALGASLYREHLPHALLIAVPLILTAVALVLRPAPVKVPPRVLSPPLRTPRPNRG
jgi:drug/metabolite transporter (DMT)-like permease